MSKNSGKPKRGPIDLYVPPSRRKNRNLQSSAACSADEGNLDGKDVDESQKPSKCLGKTYISSKFSNDISVSNINRNSVKDHKFSPPFSDINSSLQQLNLNESFEDGGLIVSGDVRTESIKVPIGAPTGNFTNPPPLDYNKYQHIIELYDFPAEADLMAVEAELRNFNSSGYIIKWVDDTHCLAVFSSALVAQQALKCISGIFLKARTVEEASVASKWKIAKSPGDWSMPYKKRPPSDASVATRFISSHLGLPRSKPSSQFLQARKEAQEKRERKKMLEQEIWGED